MSYESDIENRRLVGENHYLRECMREMHDHIKECCDDCDEWYCSEWDDDNECCRFDTMMRVCGIEVSE